MKLSGGLSYLVAGHAGGFVTIWELSDGSDWRLVNSVDVRSPHPVNPWGIHNVRGVDVLNSSASIPCVITGSEDGDLVMLEIPSGKERARICYNPKAQRGINSIAILHDVLLVANCSVGPQDFNLWAYRIDQSNARIIPLDAANLAVDSHALQVFNFDVAWGSLPSGPDAFFSTTEEGVLWMGRLGNGGKLLPMGYVPVTHATGNELLQLGSAVCYDQGRVVVANYDIAEFAVQSSTPQLPA